LTGGVIIKVQLEYRGGVIMAYYSKLRPTVYHEYKNCHVGNNLVKENLKRGKRRGARLCQTCERLSLTGKGVPGTPKLSRLYKYAAVMAYYSKEHPRPKIYHVCQNCFLGQNIERAQLRRGKPKDFKGRDGKLKKPRVCKICAKLCRVGDCIPGAPIPARVRRRRPPTNKSKPSVSKPKPSAPKPVKVGK
jgi:hypothetical protein